MNISHEYFPMPSYDFTFQIEASRLYHWAPIPRVRKVLDNITIATWDPDIRNLRGQFSRNWLKNWSEITVSGIYENWWRQEFYANSAYFRLAIPWDL